jgi:steroid 5-alpha reductase family enzyme
MKINHTIIVMFIGSFIIQYFLMSPIMVDSFSNITNSIGKAYLAVIMGLFMVLLEIGMHDMQYSVFSSTKYIIIVILLGLFIYLYKKQVAINDKQYLEEMIEHHSMALLTSEEILKKTDSYNVAKIAKNIIQKQKDEIREMKDVAKKIELN